MKSFTPALLHSTLEKGRILAFTIATVSAGAGMAQTGTIQIGSGNATSQYAPIHTCYGYNYSQQIYLASELTGSSAVPGDLTALRFFHSSEDQTAETWNHWTVLVGGTSKSAFSNSTDWVPFSDLQQVFTGTITPTIGSWMEIPFDVPINWDGTENIVVAIIEDVDDYYCTANWKAYTALENRALLYYNDDIVPEPSSPPVANYGPSNELAQVQFVGALASCLPPADIAMGALTAHSGELTWTDNTASSYNYEVRTSGAAGSGASGLFTSNSVPSGTPAIAIAGLDANTLYTVYVNGVCSGTPSQWSLPYTFKTPCDPDDVPYLEDFNAVSTPDVPECFTSEALNGQPWMTSDYLPMGMTGNSAYVYYDYPETPNVWLHTTGVNLVGGTAYRLSYKYSTGTDDEFYTANMDVQVESAPAASASIATLAEHTDFTSTSILSNATDFTVPQTGVYYFGFRYYAEVGDEPAELYLDDIQVVPVPSCEEVTGLAATTTSLTEGLVSWTASVSNPMDGYELYYNTDGTSPDENSTPQYTGITGTSRSLPGLTTGTTIYVWVRSACSATDHSFWTGPVSFTPGTFQIGAGDATDNMLPINSCYGNNYSQQIYLADEYHGGAQITDIAFKYTGDGDDIDTWHDWTVYMGNTSQSDFADGASWVPSGVMSEVWSGVITPIAGDWMNISLNTPFYWDGVSNIVVGVHEITEGYSCTANWASFDAGSNRGLSFYNDNILPDPMSPPEANHGPTNIIPQVQFAGIILPDCDAMPAPGATTGPESICPGTMFALGVENPEYNGGITHQWEVSTDGTTWSNAPGVSTTSHYQTSQTEATWYRDQVTCGAMGTTASTPIHVLVKSATECYCTTVSFQYNIEPICNVTFAGIDNTSSSVMGGSPALEDFTATTPANVTAGYDFPISVTGNPNGSFSQPEVMVFFDWDQDGTFETSQLIGTISGGVCNTPATTTISVPATALPGASHMRVIKSNWMTPDDPCAIYEAGQAEDYTVNVFLPVPCEGMPDPGATTGPSEVCPQKPFSVAVTNTVLAEGLSYQWERSSDGTTWADAPGNSTSPSYSTSITENTWFRAQVTCDISGTTASTPLEVSLKPPTECYCTPAIFSYGVDPICHVVFADLDHSSDATLDGSATYEDFSDVTATVQRGHTYSLTVSGTVSPFNGNGYVSAFFDWNGDGVFETLKQVGQVAAGSTECDSSASVNIVVPMTAAFGQSRVRIMMKEENYPANPCEGDDLEYGQTEEYTLNVLDDVGVAERSENSGIGVYPNPAHSVLHLATPGNKPMYVKVLDLAGDVVMEKAQVLDLDISKLAAGSYVLVAYDKANTAPLRARFVKQ